MMSQGQKKILSTKLEVLSKSVATLERLKKNLVDFGVKDVQKFEGKQIDDIIEQIEDLQMRIEMSHLNDEQ